MMVIMFKKNLDSTMMDIETAFLEGKLTEMIYMTIPEGLQLIEEIEDASVLSTQKIVEIQSELIVRNSTFNP